MLDRREWGRFHQPYGVAKRVGHLRLQDARIQGAADDRGVRRQTEVGAQGPIVVRGVRETLQGIEGERIGIHVQTGRLEKGEFGNVGRDFGSVERGDHAFGQIGGTARLQRLDKHEFVARS